MTGIFGFLNFDQRRSPDNLINDMALAYQPVVQDQIEIYSDNTIHLGRINLGITNPETQPIWDESHTVCLLMEGEIFDYQHQKDGLRNNNFINAYYNFIDQLKSKENYYLEKYDC